MYFFTFFTSLFSVTLRFHVSVGHFTCSAKFVTRHKVRKLLFVFQPGAHPAHFSLFCCNTHTNYLFVYFTCNVQFCLLLKYIHVNILKRSCNKRNQPIYAFLLSIISQEIIYFRTRENISVAVTTSFIDVGLSQLGIGPRSPECKANTQPLSHPGGIHRTFIYFYSKHISILMSMG